MVDVSSSPPLTSTFIVPIPTCCSNTVVGTDHLSIRDDTVGTASGFGVSCGYGFEGAVIDTAFIPQHQS